MPINPQHLQYVYEGIRKEPSINARESESLSRRSSFGHTTPKRFVGKIPHFRSFISDECVSPLMGLLDRLRGKKEVKKEEGADTGGSGAQGSSTGQQSRKIKRYTSEGKPVYE